MPQRLRGFARQGVAHPEQGAAVPQQLGGAAGHAQWIIRCHIGGQLLGGLGREVCDVHTRAVSPPRGFGDAGKGGPKQVFAPGVQHGAGVAQAPCVQAAHGLVGSGRGVPEHHDAHHDAGAAGEAEAAEAALQEALARPVEAIGQHGDEHLGTAAIDQAAHQRQEQRPMGQEGLCACASGPRRQHDAGGQEGVAQHGREHVSVNDDVGEVRGQEGHQRRDHQWHGGLGTSQFRPARIAEEKDGGGTGDGREVTKTLGRELLEEPKPIHRDEGEEAERREDQTSRPARRCHFAVPRPTTAPRRQLAGPCLQLGPDPCPTVCRPMPRARRAMQQACPKGVRPSIPRCGLGGMWLRQAGRRRRIALVWQRRCRLPLGVLARVPIPQQRPSQQREDDAKERVCQPAPVVHAQAIGEQQRGEQDHAVVERRRECAPRRPQRRQQRRGQGVGPVGGWAHGCGRFRGCSAPCGAPAWQCSSARASAMPSSGDA